MADALRVASRLNREGLLATIDLLGENVTCERDACESAAEYLSLLDEIKDKGIASAVSLKLTHLGLDLSDALAKENLESIVKKAASLGISVRIDMESSKYTQRTLDIFLRLRKEYENLGVAAQAYLFRSADDIKRLMEAGASVRLVKGAYKEPPDVAFESKEDVDRNFSILMKELISRGSRPAIATHDERLIAEARGFAQERGIPKTDFDFEMLLGIKRTLQRDLAKAGYRVRVYVPYGPQWLPYMLRRLRERRENIWFLVKNVWD
ncbi:MAG: proline dehydrogenase family protein [Deltaproteobacteria bacterium]|nr:proline dehydrogenase family protein [Deltaproteobacteria bacterium]